MLAGLIFTGIKILVSMNSPTHSSKWLVMLEDWFVGMVLLIFSHVLMVGIFYISDTLTDIISRNLIGIGGMNYSLIKQCILSFDSAELIVYLIMLGYLIYLAIVFAVAYFKRLLWICVLIVFAPIVSVMYSFGNRSKQIYHKWLKEYMLAVFVQPFHIITYFVLVSIPLNMVNSTGEIDLLGLGIFEAVFALGAICFIRPAEKYIRGLFEMNHGVASMASVDSGKQTIEAFKDAAEAVAKKVASVVTMAGVAIATGGAGAELAAAESSAAPETVKALQQTTNSQGAGNFIPGTNEYGLPQMPEFTPDPDIPITSSGNQELDMGDGEYTFKGTMNTSDAGYQYEPTYNEEMLEDNYTDSNIDTEKSNQTLDNISNQNNSSIDNQTDNQKNNLLDNSDNNKPSEEVKVKSDNNNNDSVDDSEDKNDDSSDKLNYGGNSINTDRVNITANSVNMNGENNEISNIKTKDNINDEDEENSDEKEKGKDEEKRKIEIEKEEPNKPKNPLNLFKDGIINGDINGAMKDAIKVVVNSDKMDNFISQGGIEATREAANELYKGLHTLGSTFYLDGASDDWKNTFNREENRIKDQREKIKQNNEIKMQNFINNEENQNYIIEKEGIKEKLRKENPDKSDAWINRKAKEDAKEKLKSMSQYVTYGISDVKVISKLHKDAQDYGFTPEEAIKARAGFNKFNTDLENVSYLNNYYNNENDNRNNNEPKIEAKAVSEVIPDAKEYYYNGYDNVKDMAWVDYLAGKLNTDSKRDKDTKLAMQVDKVLSAKKGKIEYSGKDESMKTVIKEIEDIYKKNNRSSTTSNRQNINNNNPINNNPSNNRTTTNNTNYRRNMNNNNPITHMPNMNNNTDI